MSPVLSLPAAGSCRDRRRPVRRRGSALIMVIFLITMLGMIVYAMHNIVKNDADLAIAQKQAFRARQLTEMGINWAMNPAIKPYDAKYLKQTFPDESMFETKIRGEGGRININALLQKMEEPTNGIMFRSFAIHLFELWGLDRDRSDDLLDMMLDWTDAGSDRHTSGWEKEDYVAQYGENTPYPFNRPFYNLDEMLLVPGFDAIAAAEPLWRDFFTIYSQGSVDVNSAEAKVLAAVTVAIKNPGDKLGMYNQLMEENGGAQEVLKLRWGKDELEDTKDDEPFQNLAEALSSLDFTPPANGQGGQLDINDENGLASLIFGLNDQTTHIECTATIGEYRKRVVLIVRGRTGQPQILNRQEMPIH